MTRKVWLILLALFTAVGPASMPALGAAEAQHPLHHGGRHRLDAAERLPPGPRWSERRPTSKVSRRRARCSWTTSPSQSCTSGRNASSRAYTLARGMIRPRLPLQPVLPGRGPGHPGDREVPAGPRLHHGRVRQRITSATTPRRCQRRTASRNTGDISIISTPYSRLAFPNTTAPRRCGDDYLRAADAPVPVSRGPGAVDPANNNVPDTPAR